MWISSNMDVFLEFTEYSMQDQRLQKHSFAPRGPASDKSSSSQSKPKSKGSALSYDAQLPTYITTAWCADKS